MLLNGNAVSKAHGISFLLDADIDDAIAKALRLFDYDVKHTKEISEFQDHLEKLYDPEIIAWCKDSGRVWITHDFESHRKHIEAIKLARIYVVWIRMGTKPNKTIHTEPPTWRMFQILVRTIDGIQHQIAKSHDAVHFRIHSKSGDSPTVDWAADGLDK